MEENTFFDTGFDKLFNLIPKDEVKSNIEEYIKYQTKKYRKF